MASYESYKKINAEGIADGAIEAADFTVALNATYGVKWFYGTPSALTSGCCCLWTVPTGVKKLHIEMWGSGGNGAGSCNCNRCHHYRGAQGGYYAAKHLDVQEGWQYTVCAAGVYRCCSRECVGCEGCSSYVNGCGLSNFCARGGENGYANTAWNTYCHSVNDCCRGPNDNNADFGMVTHSPNWSGAEFVYDRGFCHCYPQATWSTGAARIGTNVQTSVRSCWNKCGCWSAPYGNGGQNSMTSYCGSGHCGQGGTGGSGLVKITYF
tara:strand:- start:846 stop:1643 length:798 start_codon:yes stop_codon:yes gene_type:complete